MRLREQRARGERVGCEAREVPRLPHHARGLDRVPAEGLGEEPLEPVVRAELLREALDEDRGCPGLLHLAEPLEAAAEKGALRAEEEQLNDGHHQPHSRHVDPWQPMVQLYQVHPRRGHDAGRGHRDEHAHGDQHLDAQVHELQKHGGVQAGVLRDLAQAQAAARAGPGAAAGGGPGRSLALERVLHVDAREARAQAAEGAEVDDGQPRVEDQRVHQRHGILVLRHALHLSYSGDVCRAGRGASSRPLPARSRPAAAGRRPIGEPRQSLRR
mmetsp:Transcript_54699/g.155630  ORF Transcript_54699/g.155630 Transcript_54699/m.155630 type:complete len:271 (+) Transcript_54699:1432-2244(+)